MKQRETDSGRGCESRQVHHKDLPAEPQKPNSCCGKGCEGCVWLSYFEAHNLWKSLYDGPEIDSTG